MQLQNRHTDATCLRLAMPYSCVSLPTLYQAAGRVTFHRWGEFPSSCNQKPPREGSGGLQWYSEAVLVWVVCQQLSASLMPTWHRPRARWHWQQTVCRLLALSAWQHTISAAGHSWMCSMQERVWVLQPWPSEDETRSHEWRGGERHSQQLARSSLSKSSRLSWWPSSPK